MAATVRKVRGLFVALFALCVALTALPSVAFAAYATQTGDITISGVSEGDTVDIYRVVDYTYHDNDNTVTWMADSTLDCTTWTGGASCTVGT